MSYLFNNDVEITKPLNQFSELQTIQRTPVVEVIPIKGVTLLRDIPRTSGSGNFSDAFSEILLNSGTTANSFAEIDTAERGRYLAGYGGEIGIGARIANNEPTLAGTAYREWGYAKRSNGSVRDGLLYGTDATGTYVEVIRDGVSTHKKYQSEWNLDKLDGTDPSGIVWNSISGTIYQIEFTWYGYGSIVWNIITFNPNTMRQEKIPVHIYTPPDTTSIRIPNLPVHAYVTNGDQSTDYSLYVGGRQFSVVGPFEPIRRLVTERNIISTDGTFRPLVSFKSKSTEQDLAISKKISGFDITAITEDLDVEVRIDSNVANTANFQIPGNHSNSEISILTDKTATTGNSGIPIWAGEIDVSGGNQGPDEASGNKDKSGLFIDIPEDQICTVFARTISGSAGDARITLRIREEY